MLAFNILPMRGGREEMGFVLTFVSQKPVVKLSHRSPQTPQGDSPGCATTEDGVKGRVHSRRRRKEWQEGEPGGAEPRAARERSGDPAGGTRRVLGYGASLPRCESKGLEDGSLFCSWNVLH